MSRRAFALSSPLPALSQRGAVGEALPQMTGPNTSAGCSRHTPFQLVRKQLALFEEYRPIRAQLTAEQEALAGLPIGRGLSSRISAAIRNQSVDGTDDTRSNRQWAAVPRSVDRRL